MLGMEGLYVNSRATAAAVSQEASSRTMRSSNEDLLDGLSSSNSYEASYATIDDPEEEEEEAGGGGRDDGASSSGSDGSSPLGWPLGRRERSHSGMSFASTKSVSSSSNATFTWEEKREHNKSRDNFGGWEEKQRPFAWEEKREKRETSASEVELMKERFAKLLLGEDMSGGAKGVCTALAISNAITNLAASVFGELWRLEPLSAERKAMWRREMEWLLAVSDYIVELVPSWQSFRDGSNMEVMVSRPRSDIHINLPALRKLDTMLLESLDSYKETEFWYVDQGIILPEKDGQQHDIRKHSLQRQEEKWWLPTPRVPTNGLSDEARKALQYQRDCTNQILKAAMAINEQVLSEMEVPELFWETLSKNGKSCLGETMYQGLTAENFSPAGLLQQLDLATEHHASEAANRIEAAIHVWQKKIQQQHKQQQQLHQLKDVKQNAKSSWGKVKDFVAEVDRSTLVERAESLLLSLKQRYPGLPQTALDMNKIQYNRDVGQSILESYSRVLESLAFNILARIDDVLFIDDATKESLPFPVNGRGAGQIMRRVSGQLHMRMPSTTPYATPFASPNCSPPPAAVSPSSGKKTNSPVANRLGQAPAALGKAVSDYAYANMNRGSVNDLRPIVEESPRKAAESRERSYARNLESSRKLVSPPGRD